MIHGNINSLYQHSSTGREVVSLKEWNKKKRAFAKSYFHKCLSLLAQLISFVTQLLWCSGKLCWCSVIHISMLRLLLTAQLQQDVNSQGSFTNKTSLLPLITEWPISHKFNPLLPLRAKPQCWWHLIESTPLRQWQQKFCCVLEQI